MLIVIRLSSTKRLDDGLVPKCCVARLFLFEASAPGLEGASLYDVRWGLF